MHHARWCRDVYCELRYENVMVTTYGTASDCGKSTRVDRSTQG
eukprot:COSAG02_NODE_31667_length_529_cov_1.072093_1_plen_42_part_10